MLMLQPHSKKRKLIKSRLEELILDTRCNASSVIVRFLGVPCTISVKRLNRRFLRELRIDWKAWLAVDFDIDSESIEEEGLDAEGLYECMHAVKTKKFSSRKMQKHWFSMDSMKFAVTGTNVLLGGVSSKVLDKKNVLPEEVFRFCHKKMFLTKRNLKDFTLQQILTFPNRTRLHRIFSLQDKVFCLLERESSLSLVEIQDGLESASERVCYRELCCCYSSASTSTQNSIFVQERNHSISSFLVGKGSISTLKFMIPEALQASGEFQSKNAKIKQLCEILFIPGKNLLVAIDFHGNLFFWKAVPSREAIPCDFKLNVDFYFNLKFGSKFRVPVSSSTLSSFGSQFAIMTNLCQILVFEIRRDFQFCISAALEDCMITLTDSVSSLFHPRCILLGKFLFCSGTKGDLVVYDVGSNQLIYKLDDLSHTKETQLLFTLMLGNRNFGFDQLEHLWTFDSRDRSFSLMILASLSGELLSWEFSNSVTSADIDSNEFFPERVVLTTCNKNA